MPPRHPRPAVWTLAVVAVVAAVWLGSHTGHAQALPVTVPPQGDAQQSVTWALGIVGGLVAIVVAIVGAVKLRGGQPRDVPARTWADAIGRETRQRDSQHQRVRATLAEHRRETELLRSQLDAIEASAAANREAAAREAGTITEALRQLQRVLERMEARIDGLMESR